MVGTTPAGRRWAGVVGGVAPAPDGEAIGATASAPAAAVLGAVGAAASTAAALGAVDAASSAPAAAALGGVVTPEAGAARRVYTAPKRPRGGGAGAWRATVERRMYTAPKRPREGGAAADGAAAVAGDALLGVEASGRRQPLGGGALCGPKGAAGLQAEDGPIGGAAHAGAGPESSRPKPQDGAAGTGLVAWEEATRGSAGGVPTGTTRGDGGNGTSEGLVSSKKSKASCGVGEESSAKGKEYSSKTTCREMMTRFVLRSRQRYPL